MGAGAFGRGCLPEPDCTIFPTEPDIARALADGRPVIAIQTAMLAHALPFSGNLDLPDDCTTRRSRKEPCPHSSLSRKDGSITVLPGKRFRT